MNTITRKQAIEMIDKHSGEHTIFSVKFIKKDGTERDMICRFNVVSHLRGGRNTSEGNESIRTVFDMQKKAYRKFNVDTIKQLRLNKQTYLVV